MSEKTHAYLENAQDIVGSEIKPFNDYLAYTESETEGGTIVELSSTDMFEEDLEQLEKHPTRLSEERINAAVNNAIFGALEFISKHVDEKKIKRLFPDIDLTNFENYDFSKSRIKVVPLAQEDYQLISKELFNETDSNSSGGFAKMTAESQSGTMVNKITRVNLANKSIAIINETPEFVVKALEKTKPWPRQLTPRDEELIEMNIEATTIHELLHIFDIASDLPRRFREGVTEWYAQQILRENYSEEQVKSSTWVGYSTSVDAVDTLVSNLMKQGVDIDTFDKAFMARNKESVEKIVDAITSRYGKKAAEQILTWDFKSPKDELTTILRFEHDFEKGQKEKTYDYKR